MTNQTFTYLSENLPFANAEDFQKQLNNYGQFGWKLVTAIPLQTVEGVQINGQPRIKISFLCTFIKAEE